MDAAVTREFTKVDDYLAREEASKIKHEYVAGFVYAVAPTTEAHDQIASNLYVAFRQNLRGRDWKPYLSHVRVHVEALGDVFYYPDVVVGGDRRDTHPSF